MIERWNGITRRAGAGLAVLAAGVLLAGVSSGEAQTADTGSGSGSWFPNLFGSSTPEKVDPKLLRRFEEHDAFCPQVRVRTDANFMPVIEKSGKEQVIRFQAVIARFARQCTESGGAVHVTVGVGGRMLSGPQGGAGVEDLPIHFVLELNGKPVYDVTRMARATIGEGEGSAFWTVTDDGISIPQPVAPDQYYEIFVGFPKPVVAPKPAAPKPVVHHHAPRPHKPRPMMPGGGQTVVAPVAN